MKKDSFKIASDFSPRELQQTDFGRIYYNIPSEIFFPKTTHELASTLGAFYQKGVPVTIRNTGHSMNGQTLTSGVQINLSKLKNVSFNIDEMTVHAGAGNSWDEVFKCIDLPKYCTHVFANNPGQQIQIGGTASVGGIGFYGSKYGGFWNHVKKLTFVTMTGEIITCSREENFDLMRFVLAGFGRIGVIAELEVEVIKSKPYCLTLGFAYTDFSKLYDGFIAGMDCELVDALIVLTEKPKVGKFGNIPLYILPVTVDVDDDDDDEKIIAQLQEYFHKRSIVFPEMKYDKSTQFSDMDISLIPKRYNKKEIVYYYPDDKEHTTKSNPWLDFVITKEHYLSVIPEVQKIVKKYNMERLYLTESIVNDFFQVAEVGDYLIKKQTVDKESFFPLSLDFEDHDLSIHWGWGIATNGDEIEAVTKMIKEIHEIVYGVGGKRYMYGYHQLTKEQIEIQYGREYIDQWQSIKDKLDPKHLLNIDVIEHLDRM